MRRFSIGSMVALLAFSVSGVSALVVPEPCAAYENTNRQDGACAPTCVTCGCCAQAAEPVVLEAADSLGKPVANITPPAPALPHFEPHDILHVPKSLLS